MDQQYVLIDYIFTLSFSKELRAVDILISLFRVGGGGDSKLPQASLSDI